MPFKAVSAMEHRGCNISSSTSTILATIRSLQLICLDGFLQFDFFLYVFFTFIFEFFSFFGFVKLKIKLN